MTPTPPPNNPPVEGAPPPVTPPANPPADPAVQRMQAEVNRYRQEAERLRAQVLQPPAGVPAAPAQPDIRELNRQFNASPVQMAAAIAERAAFETHQRLNAGSLDTQIQMARSLARQGNEQLFDRYAGEIDAIINDDRQVAPNLRTSVTVWKNIFSLVRGNHVDEIIAEARNQPPAAPAIVRPGTGPAAVPPPAAPAAPGVQLTDLEKKWARKFHLTDEQYIQGRQDNEKQSDALLDPVGPSSWDKYVTFSTDDKVRAAREARRKAAQK